MTGREGGGGKVETFGGPPRLGRGIFMAGA